MAFLVTRPYFFCSSHQTYNEIQRMLGKDVAWLRKVDSETVYAASSFLRGTCCIPLCVCRRCCYDVNRVTDISSSGVLDFHPVIPTREYPSGCCRHIHHIFSHTPQKCCHNPTDVGGTMEKYQHSHSGS